eukprot:TRINITY_DN66583_c13_g2_i1.p1 TRINITY_DN66583_c13_g2~~TRINITY_DN66583_c13_g2_i1.p1  ORF type:complete len:781 (-),score=393.03 TRINITY_DN66583_c13_g2_i1:1558-3858(-)
MNESLLPPNSNNNNNSSSNNGNNSSRNSDEKTAAQLENTEQWSSASSFRVEARVMGRQPSELENWMFPGWGRAEVVHVRASPQAAVAAGHKEFVRKKRTKSNAAYWNTQVPLAEAAGVVRRRSSRSSNGEAPPEMLVNGVEYDGHGAGHQRFSDNQEDGFDGDEDADGLSDEAPEVINRILEQESRPPHALLGQLAATAICGNDITASCFYTVGLTATYAGVFAPAALLAVGIMLYFFRAVYAEVVTSKPENGGAYNALLNTTAKSTASIAACLTILSYIATAVVSASSASSYLGNVVAELDETMITIGLLGFFALLNIIGINESATVATVLFLVHIGTLLVLVTVSFIKFTSLGFSTHFVPNFHSDLQMDVGKAIFYGFSAASLGISGFETSANFVEEQREGVFPLTLRNMWAATFVFNPLLGFFSLTNMPMADITESSDVVLAKLGGHSSGHWLEVWISIDAFLVLSGSIITSFVGVCGLCKRLAGDRCLPAFLTTENEWRRTPHWIIISFFCICVSMYLALHGNTESLSGVYSIAFLTVMALFAVGDMLLKYKRGTMPRKYRASWPAVISAFVLVVIALFGTILRKPQNLRYFVFYFTGTATLFFVTFARLTVLKLTLSAMRRILKGTRLRAPVERFLQDAIHAVTAQSIVFFSNTSRLDVMNKAILYIRENEQTRHVLIVHVCEKESDVPSHFAEHVQVLDALYPKVQVDSLVLLGIPFCRDAVDELTERYDIPPNLMFIAAPGKRFRVKIASLGGVRVITH